MTLERTDFQQPTLHPASEAAAAKNKKTQPQTPRLSSIRQPPIGEFNFAAPAPISEQMKITRAAVAAIDQRQQRRENHPE